MQRSSDRRKQKSKRNNAGANKKQLEPKMTAVCPVLPVGVRAGGRAPAGGVVLGIDWPIGEVQIVVGLAIGRCSGMEIGGVVLVVMTAIATEEEEETAGAAAAAAVVIVTGTGTAAATVEDLVIVVGTVAVMVATVAATVATVAVVTGIVVVAMGIAVEAVLATAEAIAAAALVTAAAIAVAALVTAAVIDSATAASVIVAVIAAATASAAAAEWVGAMMEDAGTMGLLVTSLQGSVPVSTWRRERCRRATGPRRRRRARMVSLLSGSVVDC